MAYPRAGKHYPRSVGEFQAWFRTDADCLDYLEWLRWPEGFVCPTCGHEDGWRLGDGRFECSACSTRSSVTAGTIFDRTRTPLTVWFTACWLFATGKYGISALSLKRVLEIGSYQTAWAMLHRLRSVLVRPGRDLLSGTVQVDETYIGGAEPGLAGGRAKGKKVLTVIAVEVREPRGLGRCRISPLADASGESLQGFVMDHVEPGSTIVTDGWPPYQGLAQLGYEHDRRSQGAARARGDDPNKLLPAVHRVASLAKRWLLGTHQGAADSAHMSHYLNEFAAAAWYSIACSNWPSATNRCVSRTSSPADGRGRCPPSHLSSVGIPRAWSAQGRIGRGGRPSARGRMRFTPVKWIPP